MKQLILALSVLACSYPAFAGCIGHGEDSSLQIAYQKAIGDAYGICGKEVTCREGCWIKTTVIDAWLMEKLGDLYKVGVSLGTECSCHF